MTISQNSNCQNSNCQNPSCDNSCSQTPHRYNVLFLDHDNAARSIMAQSILQKEAPGRFCAYSAGVSPKEVVSPIALRVLYACECTTKGLSPKSASFFTTPDAPRLDFIFTLSDEDCGETLPYFAGQSGAAPMQVNWRIEDPCLVTGNALAIEASYVRTYRYLRNRISLFANLPLEQLDMLTLNQRLESIGTFGVDRLDASYFAATLTDRVHGLKGLSTAA